MSMFRVGALFLLSVFLISASVIFPVNAEDSCVITVKEVAGIHTVEFTGCEKVTVKVNGTMVYPSESTATTVATASAPVIFQDGGSSVPYTAVVNAKILAKELNVRPEANLEEANTPVGKAQKDRYYQVTCKGTDNWFKIKFNGKENWIHAKGTQGEYAEVINPSNIGLPDC